MRDPVAPISGDLLFARAPVDPGSEAAQLCVLRSVAGSWAVMRVRRIDGLLLQLRVATVPSMPASRAQVARLMDAIVAGFSGSLLTHVGVCLLGRTVVSELSKAAQEVAHIPASLFFLDLEGGVRRADGELRPSEAHDPEELILRLGRALSRPIGR